LKGGVIKYPVSGDKGFLSGGDYEIGGVSIPVLINNKDIIARKFF